MHIDGNIITADEGKALKNKQDTATRTRITRVCLGPSDAAANWEDCEYGDPTEDEATEADKDAALTALGVDMTESAANSAANAGGAE